MIDLYPDPRYALCLNSECGVSVEFASDIELPLFCTRCKWPLFTACLPCYHPFVCRPEKYCGLCSDPLVEDGLACGTLMVLIYDNLRKRDQIPERAQYEAICCHRHFLKSIESFPFLRLRSNDVLNDLRYSGLDILLSPPSEKLKNSFLKLVKNPE